MLRLYFPATFFLQYVDEATDIKDFRHLVDENKLKVLSDFIKPNTVEDIRTTVLMLPNLRDRFKELKEALYGLILGRDVILYFAREEPVEMLWEMDRLNLDILTLKNLRLRKYSVIERIITVDLVFRLYYTIYGIIKEELKKYRKARSYVKNMTIKQSSRYATIERSYTPFERKDGSNVMHIYVSRMLHGVISSCFPLLSMSGVFQLAMLNFFVSGRYTEVNEILSGLKSTRKLSKPSEAFLQDCEYHFERAVESYGALLDRFANEVKAIIEEKDPIEEFIKSCLPATFFDIYEKAKVQGFDVDEVMFKLRDLIRRGVIKSDGEMLKT